MEMSGDLAHARRSSVLRRVCAVGAGASRGMPARGRSVSRMARGGSAAIEAEVVGPTTSVRRRARAWAACRGGAWHEVDSA